MLICYICVLVSIVLVFGESGELFCGVFSLVGGYTFILGIVKGEL